MKVVEAAGLFLRNALWRATGSPSAGRALMQALDSADEDLRTLAGILLVKGGRRSRPLLEEALEKREHLPMALRILGDLGEPGVAAEVGAFTNDSDPEVAEAARETLRVLEFAAQSGRSG